MSKLKKATSDAELADLFASVKQNNSDLDRALTIEEIKPVMEVKHKKVDKSPKDAYNHNKAFGIYKNEDTGKWDVLEIDFDVQSGTARIVDTLVSVNNKLVAQRRAEEAMSRVLNKLPLLCMRKNK